VRKKRKECQWRNLNSEETSEEEKKRVSVAKPEQVRKGLGKKDKKRVSVAKPEQVRKGKKRVSVAKPEQ
jgi:cell division protein FtsL